MDEEWSDDWDDGDAWDEMVDQMEARGRGGKRRSRVINLFGKRGFDYSYLATGTSQDIIIRRALPVIPYYYYWLMLRVHEVNLQNTGSGFDLNAYNTLPSKQDPQEFTEAGAGVLSVSIVQGAVSAGDLVKNADNNQGPFFKIVLTANQASGSAGRVYAELSAVLYCRTAGP